MWRRVRLESLMYLLTPNPLPILAAPSAPRNGHYPQFHASSNWHRGRMRKALAEHFRKFVETLFLETAFRAI